MGIKTFRPITPGLRHRIQVVNTEITTNASAPQKALTRGKKSNGGRASNGRISVRHQGGGHKQKYRDIDFKRDKIGGSRRRSRDRVRPEPLREYRPRQLRRRREALHPQPQGPGGREEDRRRADRRDRAGQRAAPRGDPRRHHRPQRRAHSRQGRPAGALRGRQRPDSGQGGRLRRPPASLGRAPNGLPQVHGDHRLRRERRAHERAPRQGGRTRWLGVRPTVRGTVMNPVDHPHGGGEGRGKGYKQPVSPWGQPAKGYKTRDTHKPSSRFIVKRRK